MLLLAGRASPRKMWSQTSSVRSSTRTPAFWPLPKRSFPYMSTTWFESVSRTRRTRAKGQAIQLSMSSCGCEKGLYLARIFIFRAVLHPSGFPFLSLQSRDSLTRSLPCELPQYIASASNECRRRQSQDHPVVKRTLLVSGAKTFWLEVLVLDFPLAHPASDPFYRTPFSCSPARPMKRATDRQEQPS